MDSELNSFLDSITFNSRRKVRKEVPEEKMGQHSRELNPYWKDGGCGLPNNEPKRQTTVVGGDGGLSWWKKGLQRCEETASREGRKLEEVAADKFGSLDFLLNKIRDAEQNITSTSKFQSHMKGNNYWKDTTMRKPVDGDHTSFHSGGSHAHGKRKVRKESKDIQIEPTNMKKHEPTLIREPCSGSGQSFVISPSLSDKEKNAISAKLLRAQLMGDTALTNKLNAQLAAGSPASSSSKRDEKRKLRDNESDDDDELLVVTNSKGSSVPFPERKTGETSGSSRKRQKVETHKRGERVKYFHDDDEHSLESLVRNEKLNIHSSGDQAMFNKLSGKIGHHFNDEDDLVDDEILRKEATNKPASIMDSKEKQLAIIEQSKMALKIGNCAYCFQNIQKHLIVTIGTNVLLCLPRHQSMVTGHCLIIPTRHVTQSTVCDEDVIQEINDFKKSLVRMFRGCNHDVVFMETSKNLKAYPHLAIECIPMPRDIGEEAPLYFQKAINECGPEWNRNNKKLISIKKGIKKSIPPGFPYFHVAFGTDEGYGHVIEDERTFPSHFGREVIGGMLDLDHTLWRRPKFDDFEQQRKKVIEFTKVWKSIGHMDEY